MDRAILRNLPLFADLSGADLERFLARATEIEIDAGTTLIHEGDDADAVYIIIQGELEVSRRVGERQVSLGIRTNGDVIGEMAPLTNERRNATVRARSQTRLLCIDTSDFAAVLNSSPTVALTIMRTVIMRLRNTEGQLAQQHKMAALGTLAAGLAHELNNPAAALGRVTAQLQDAFERCQMLTTRVEHQDYSPEQTALLERLRAAMFHHPPNRSALDPIARSQQEAALEGWLEDHGIDRPWELAAQLLDEGWDQSLLDDIGRVMSAEHLPDVLWWFATGCTITGLLAELGRSAHGISGIVAAVKSYTYLDQAPIQEIDIQVGLEQALLLLQHRLKHVSVQRDYASLPRITAYGSELNQVWTNIIDNAIDAIGGTGAIRIETFRDAHNVVVAIEDNGPGIPPDVKQHLFDPFFTTKAPGHGTGLGLSLSYNIIVEKHHGKLEVETQPGRTRFLVTLPIEFQG